MSWAGRAAYTPWGAHDPAEAAAFVTATGIDALAVAVGTEHHMTVRTPSSTSRLIETAATRPWTARSSFTAPRASRMRTLFARCGLGISKVNISTHLNSIFTAALREQLLVEPTNVDPRVTTSKWAAMHSAARRNACSSSLQEEPLR